MAISSAVSLILALFGAFVGALGGLFTGWIVRRAAPMRSGISLHWIVAGWAVAWAIGLGMIPLLTGTSAPDTVAMAVAFGTSAIGGIGGGVTFWQIEQAHRRSSAVVVEMTTPAPRAVPLDKSIRQSIIVVCSGWIVSWVVGVAWTQTSPVSLTVMYVSWAGVSLITGFVLRYVAPAIEWKRIALIAIGWPLCLTVGTATASQNNWTLPVGVAACGWLAASTLIPLMPGRNWLYGGVAAATWAASWSVGSSYAWGVALAVMNSIRDMQLFGVTRIRSDVSFVFLILGTILSGVIGGRMLYMLFHHARHELSTMEASPRSKAMLDKIIARPIAVLGGGWIGVWMIAILVAQSFLSPDESITALRVSWIVIGLLTGFALYRIAPDVQKYALLIAIGWPLCLITSAAISPSNIAMVAAAAVCGLLAAWSLTPLMPPISWLQRLWVAGVWAGCWAISSSTWSTALLFINVNHQRLAQFTLGRFTTFISMTSGAILSGVLGSMVLYWLIDNARRKAIRSTSQSE